MSISQQGLAGECDFILAIGPALPPLHAPVMTVVEAKKNDVEAGLGQCIAQMVGAERFNDAAGRINTTVFGCVTTGETWQFLQLDEQSALLDRPRYYLDNVGRILGVLRLDLRSFGRVGLTREYDGSQAHPAYEQSILTRTSASIASRSSSSGMGFMTLAGFSS